MARKRRTWKLSDTVAAVFFGLWLLSLPFRPWLGGLEILVIIVGLIWAASLWATAVYGEYPQPPHVEKKDAGVNEISDVLEDFETNPIYGEQIGNINKIHEKY